MLSPYIVFTIVIACLSIAGVLVAIGVLKGKIHQNAKEIEKLAPRDELAAAIKRSDELLSILKGRAEEDRAKGQGFYREFHGILKGHETRIASLETSQTGLSKSLDELKKDIKSGFSDLRTELKELQKEIKESRNQG